eukprot:1073946-Prymnesium_polylepis.1
MSAGAIVTMATAEGPSGRGAPSSPRPRRTRSTRTRRRTSRSRELQAGPDDGGVLQAAGKAAISFSVGAVAWERKSRRPKSSVT